MTKAHAPAMKCPPANAVSCPLRKRLMASVVVLTELNHMSWPGAAVPALASASMAPKAIRSLPVHTRRAWGWRCSSQVICSSALVRDQPAYTVWCSTTSGASPTALSMPSLRWMDEVVDRSPAIANRCSLPSGPWARWALPAAISAWAVRYPASAARGSSDPIQ